MFGSTGPFGVVRPRAVISLVSKPSRSANALMFPAESSVACPSDRPLRFWIITRGWAARVRRLGGGRRQIFNFLLPGDSFMASLDGRGFKATGIVALTPIQLIPVDEMVVEPGQRPGLENACRVAAADEVNLVLDHLMRLGQQTALERTAHLLLELADRLSAVHLTDEQTFNLPVTQECLAQALGMSSVHLNRTLHKLKADGLIAMRGSRVTLRQPGRLRRLCAYGSEAQSAPVNFNTPQVSTGRGEALTA